MKLKARGDFLKKWAVRFWWNINVALTGEGTSLSLEWGRELAGLLLVEEKKPSKSSESGDRHFLEDSSSNCVLTRTHRDTPKLSLWWQKVWIVWWCRMQPRLLEGFAQSAWYQGKNNSGSQGFLQGWFYSENVSVWEFGEKPAVTKLSVKELVHIYILSLSGNNIQMSTWTLNRFHLL